MQCEKFDALTGDPKTHSGRSHISAANETRLSYYGTHWRATISMQLMWQMFFLKNSDITRHLKAHSWERAYQCSKCDHPYSHNHYLYQYI